MKSGFMELLDTIFNVGFLILEGSVLTLLLKWFKFDKKVANGDAEKENVVGTYCSRHLHTALKEYQALAKNGEVWVTPALTGMCGRLVNSGQPCGKAAKFQLSYAPK